MEETIKQITVGLEQVMSALRRLDNQIYHERTPHKLYSLRARRHDLDWKGREWWFYAISAANIQEAWKVAADIIMMSVMELTDVTLFEGRPKEYFEWEKSFDIHEGEIDVQR